MKTRHFVLCHDRRSSFVTPPLTPDISGIQSRSPVASPPPPPPPPPPPRANGIAQDHPDGNILFSQDGATYGLSAAALQNIREQMAKSLERMRELEDQVKVIPVLQVQLSVLKEEKRKMLLELRGPQHKINNLNNNNINTVTDGENKQVLRIDENDLKVRKHCCNVENEPLKSQSPRPKKDVGVGATVKTREVGVSPPRSRVRTVCTMTTRSPEAAKPAPPPSVDHASVITDLLMQQIYTEADLQRRVEEALRSYETKLRSEIGRNRFSVGVQTQSEEPRKPLPRLNVVTQTDTTKTRSFEACTQTDALEKRSFDAITQTDTLERRSFDAITQTDTVEKRLFDVAVTAKPRTADVGINFVPRTRDFGVSDCAVDDIDCEKCRVKKQSIGVGSGFVREEPESSSLSLSSLGVPRSKSFIEFSTKTPEPTTRTFGCGTTERYTPKLNRATNTDAPTPIVRKDVGVLTVKKKLVDVGVDVDLTPRSSESVHTCDKCSAVIKEVAEDVLSRSRETVAAEAHQEASVPPHSRIPRFTGSSGSAIPSSQTSPCPSMTSSLTTPSAQRKFMRQDTYTKIPASSSSKTSPDRRSRSSQRKASSSPAKSASTTERTEWSDSEESVQDTSETQTPADTPAETPSEPPSTSQLFKPIHNESRVKSEPSKEMKAAMKVLNDSLEKNQRSLQGAVPANLKSAFNVVQQEWFKVSSTKSADPFEVEDYLDHFEGKSPKLLEYIVNMTDNSGNTAMHYAVSHGNFDVVSILLDSKVCHVDVCNAAGYTSVMLVSLAEIRSEAHRHVVKRLLKLADVNSRGKQHGQTALMLAVSHGRVDTVRLLLEAGADINIQDEDGSTALMCAAEHGHLEIVKLLLAQTDCDVTIVDFDGSTALTIAMEADHRDIGVLLYAQQHFSRGSSPYASLKSRRSKSVTPTMRTSATPPPTRRTPTTPTSPLPSHKLPLKFNQSL